MTETWPATETADTATRDLVMPLSEARTNFRSIVDDVSEAGTQYTITRHGRPVAVVLGHDEYESLIETLNILSDDDTMDAIAEAEDEFGSADR